MTGVRDFELISCNEEERNENSVSILEGDSSNLQILTEIIYHFYHLNESKFYYSEVNIIIINR